MTYRTIQLGNATQPFQRVRHIFFHAYGNMSKMYSVRNQVADLSVSLSTVSGLPPQPQYIHKKVNSEKTQSKLLEKDGISRRQRERWGMKLFHFLLCIFLDYFIFFISKKCVFWSWRQESVHQKTRCSNFSSMMPHHPTCFHSLKTSGLFCEKQLIQFYYTWLRMW